MIEDVFYGKVQRITADGAMVQFSQDPADVTEALPVLAGPPAVGGDVAVVQSHGTAFVLPIGDAFAGGSGGAGVPGVPGPAGPKGDPGADGHDGATGPAGHVGPAGHDGLGVRILSAVAHLADLPTSGNTPGDAHLVTATGNLVVWGNGKWHNAGHIQGPPGHQGAPGHAGAAGGKGDPGAAGPAGPKGDPGAAGARGVAGAAGHAGAAGADGSKGDPGAAGPAGKSLHVYKQSTAPQAAVLGDIWVKT